MLASKEASNKSPAISEKILGLLIAGDVHVIMPCPVYPRQSKNTSKPSSFRRRFGNASFQPHRIRTEVLPEAGPQLGSIEVMRISSALSKGNNKCPEIKSRLLLLTSMETAETGGGEPAKIQHKTALEEMYSAVLNTLWL